MSICLARISIKGQPFQQVLSKAIPEIFGKISNKKWNYSLFLEKKLIWPGPIGATAKFFFNFFSYTKKHSYFCNNIDITILAKIRLLDLPWLMAFATGLESPHISINNHDQIYRALIALKAKGKLKLEIIDA